MRIKSLIFDILHPLLNESDQISTRILDTLFSRVIEPQKSNNKETFNLSVNLIRKGNQHFEFFVQNVSFKFKLIFNKNPNVIFFYL